MPEPYYSDEWVTIYHGDCREVLPHIERPLGTIITDPVWPNAIVQMFGQDNPAWMFETMWQVAHPLPLRAAVQLGCDSDPRFLAAVPKALPFFRVAWLEFVRMGYKGRLGVTGDVGYLFGQPPASRPGHHIIPGRMTDPSPNGQETAHPCPRKLSHVRWLVNWWTEPGETVIDPFMGSGTTLRAAADLGRKAIGIEVEERWCEMAAQRMAQGVLHVV